MMGFQGNNQERLFYSFNLEDHIPQNHLLRGIDHYLDLSNLRQHLSEFYSHTGRPSIDPELMIRMLIIGYSFNKARGHPLKARSQEAKRIRRSSFFER